jgi:predicted metal-dependent hydrolase
MSEREMPPRLEYVDGEAIRWLGRDLRLRVVEGAKRNKARIRAELGIVELALREGADRAAREAAIEACWRAGLEAILPGAAGPWEERLAVSATAWTVRRMTSRWGSCNTKTGRICLNLELARRAPACLEYVIVHELAHLKEAGHGPRFKAILDRTMPDWRAREKLLAAEALPRRRR